MLRFDVPVIQPSFDYPTKIRVSKIQNADIECSSNLKWQNFQVLETKAKFGNLKAIYFRSHVF